MKSLLMLSFILTTVFSFGDENPRTLFDAIKDGNLGEVKQMAHIKSNLDARDEQNLTPLMLAAKQASVENVKTLVVAGADLNAHDKGFTVIDQVESYLRRTGDNKKRAIEMMKRDGYSKQLIESMEKDAAALNESPEQIRKWQAILAYLKQVKESNDIPDSGREKLSAGASSNRVEGANR
jgi:ankyrin repeat protein